LKYIIAGTAEVLLGAEGRTIGKKGPPVALALVKLKPG
jgi:hypothetical protein